MKDLSRKQFLGYLAKGALAACAVPLVMTCGGDDDGGADAGGGGGDCVANGGNVTIGSNHGHSMTVSAADVNAGTEKVYDISGGGGHAHSVTLTANHFGTLATGAPVTVDSTSGNAHTHSVTVTCA